MEFFDTFTPAVKPSTICIIFTITISLSWDIQYIDVNNASLNDVLQETEGHIDASRPTLVFCLKKSLYDLKQALGLSL